MPFKKMPKNLAVSEISINFAAEKPLQTLAPGLHD